MNLWGGVDHQSSPGKTDLYPQKGWIMLRGHLHRYLVFTQSIFLSHGASAGELTVRLHHMVHLQVYHPHDPITVPLNTGSMQISSKSFVPVSFYGLDVAALCFLAPHILVRLTDSPGCKRCGRKWSLRVAKEVFELPTMLMQSLRTTKHMY